MTWRLAARLLASLAALLVVAVLVGEQALRTGTAVLAPAPVLLALVLGAVWRSLAATRWLLLSRALGADLTWPEAVSEYFRSELVNQVVPGGVVGDVDRARRHGSDVGLLPAARAVFLERTVGQLVLVAATVVTLLLRPELLTVADGADGRTATTLGVVGILVLAVVVVLWQPWRTGRARRPAQTAQTPRTPATAGDGPSLRSLAVPLVASVALSVAVLLCFVTLFLVAARVTGTDADVGVLVPAVLVVLLVSGIPLTVAGWGAREAGAALCFAAVGLAAADGVAAAVGYGLLSLVSALPGLVPLVLPRRASGGVEGTPQVQVEADVVTQPERA